MSSATTAPTLHGAGNYHGARAPRAPKTSTPVSPATAELLTFVRALRTSDWRSLAPIVATSACAAILAFIAGASPPSLTVRRMLAEEPVQTVTFALQGPATADSVQPTAEPGTLSGSSDADDYRLPAYWQWPMLDVVHGAVPGAACDPASSDGC